MTNLTNLSKRFVALTAAVLLLVGLAVPTVVPKQAQAAQLTSRSLSISSSANGNISTDVGGNVVNPGAGGNGAKAKHTVTFTMATNNATIGSFLVMYCTSPILQATCTTPTGMSAANLTSATVSGITGAGGFALDTSTSNASINSAIPANTGACNGSGTTRDNCVAIKHSSGQSQTGTPTVTIQYGGGASDYIKNPTSDNYSFYARLVVFSDTGYTTQVDYGGVAASTAQQVDITAKVQEVLNFSVGTTVTAPGATCTAFSDSGALTLGDPTNGVLSTTTAYDAHSYFRANTNTLNGTAVYYSGDTLKSGANTITSVGESAAGTSSSPGSKQFGLAIDPSDTQSGSGYSFTDLAAETSPNNYGSGNGTITSGGTAKFQFNTGSTTSPIKIAHSTGGINCDTGSVRYIGNISTSTVAGIYTTTITYIATGTY